MESGRWTVSTMRRRASALRLFTRWAANVSVLFCRDCQYTGTP